MVPEYFGSHVVGSADAGAGQVLGGVEHLGDAEVPQLDEVLLDAVVLLEEEVLGLEIPVQDFLVVEVVDGEGDLGEPVEDLRLGEVLALLLHVFDFGVHVAEFAVDHDDAEVALVVGEGVLVGDDVDVPEFLEDLELVLDVLPLLLVDLKGFDLLEGVVVALVGPVLAKEDVPRGARSEPKYPVPISFPISYSYIHRSLFYYIIPTQAAS